MFLLSICFIRALLRLHSDLTRVSHLAVISESLNKFFFIFTKIRTLRLLLNNIKPLITEKYINNLNVEKKKSIVGKRRGGKWGKGTGGIGLTGFHVGCLTDQTVQATHQLHFLIYKLLLLMLFN